MKHALFPDSLMFSMIVTIFKSKNGDIVSNDNHSLIALATVM